jgi:hypothetical protein
LTSQNQFPMPVPSGPSRSVVRGHVLDALALIHLSEVVFVKRSGMPREQIAHQLLRYWLDTIYAPGIRYMDGFKGDRNPEEVAMFVACFTEEELEWLERFNRFLELRIDRLRPADRDANQFPIKDTWNGIVRDAGNLIALIEPDRYQSKKRLDRIRSEIEIGGLLTRAQSNSKN